MIFFVAYTRVGGNKKGVFTRQRQPKTAAYILRKRYHYLGKTIDGASLPIDLTPYIHNLVPRDEL